MEPKPLKPISTVVFGDKITAPLGRDSNNYLEYFQNTIDNIATYAIGPFYWFIPDNTSMRVIAASENICLLTPYSNFKLSDWDINSVHGFADLIHPEDRQYVLSAILYVMERAENTCPDKLKLLKFNVYGRFKNAQHIYRPVLVQFPAFYIGDRVESVIVLVTDLAHLHLVAPPLLTICDYSNKVEQHFKIIMDTRKEIQMVVPKITNRESDVIKLMTKGLTTPQIAEVLCISYSTVENHRKNLRKKTNTKTSAELINYIIYNNLL